MAGLSPPFLLKVQPMSGPPLYSIGTQFGVVNIDYYTDVIARIWYGIQGISIDDVSNNIAPIAQNPPPSPAQLVIIVKP